jgi:hypothetical protein
MAARDRSSLSFSGGGDLRTCNIEGSPVMAPGQDRRVASEDLFPPPN